MLFYLDVRSSYINKKLKHAISRHGGEVSNDLSSEISLIVSDQASNNKATGFRHINVSSIEGARSRRLLQKALGCNLNPNAKNHVESVALEKNISIYSPDQFLVWLKRTLPLKTENECSKASDKSSERENLRKITKGRNANLYRQKPTMRQSNPMRRIFNKNTKCLQRSPPPPNRGQRLLKKNFLKVEDDKRTMRPLYKENLFKELVFCRCQHNVFHSEHITPNLLSSGTSSSSSPVGIRQSVRFKNAYLNLAGFCEVCDWSFPCTWSHITGDVHKENVDQSSYSDVDRLISKFPTIEDCIDKHWRRKENASKARESKFLAVTDKFFVSESGIELSDCKSSSNVASFSTSSSQFEKPDLNLLNTSNSRNENPPCLSDSLFTMNAGKLNRTRDNPTFRLSSDQKSPENVVFFEKKLKPSSVPMNTLTKQPKEKIEERPKTPKGNLDHFRSQPVVLIKSTKKSPFNENLRRFLPKTFTNDEIISNSSLSSRKYFDRKFKIKSKENQITLNKNTKTKNSNSKIISEMQESLSDLNPDRFGSVNFSSRVVSPLLDINRFPLTKQTGTNISLFSNDFSNNYKNQTFNIPESKENFLFGSKTILLPPQNYYLQTDSPEITLSPIIDILPRFDPRGVRPSSIRKISEFSPSENLLVNFMFERGMATQNKSKEAEIQGGSARHPEWVVRMNPEDGEGRRERDGLKIQKELVKTNPNRDMKKIFVSEKSSDLYRNENLFKSEHESTRYFEHRFNSYVEIPRNALVSLKKTPRNFSIPSISFGPTECQYSTWNLNLRKQFHDKESYFSLAQNVNAVSSKSDPIRSTLLDQGINKGWSGSFRTEKNYQRFKESQFQPKNTKENDGIALQYLNDLQIPDLQSLKENKLTYLPSNHLNFNLTTGKQDTLYDDKRIWNSNTINGRFKKSFNSFEIENSTQILNEKEISLNLRDNRRVLSVKSTSGFPGYVRSGLTIEKSSSFSGDKIPVFNPDLVEYSSETSEFLKSEEFDKSSLFYNEDPLNLENSSDSGSSSSDVIFTPFNSSSYYIKNFDSFGKDKTSSLRGSDSDSSFDLSDVTRTDIELSPWDKFLLNDAYKGKDGENPKDEQLMINYLLKSENGFSKNPKPRNNQRGGFVSKRMINGVGNSMAKKDPGKPATAMKPEFKEIEDNKSIFKQSDDNPSTKFVMTFSPNTHRKSLKSVFVRTGKTTMRPNQPNVSRQLEPKLESSNTKHGGKFKRKEEKTSGHRINSPKESKSLNWELSSKPSRPTSCRHLHKLLFKKSQATSIPDFTPSNCYTLSTIPKCNCTPNTSFLV